MVYQLNKYRFDSSAAAGCSFTCRGTLPAAGDAIVLPAQEYKESWHCTLSVCSAAESWRWVQSKLCAVVLTIKVSLRQMEQKLIRVVKHINRAWVTPLRRRLSQQQLIPRALRLWGKSYDQFDKNTRTALGWWVKNIAAGLFLSFYHKGITEISIKISIKK